MAENPTMEQNDSFFQRVYEVAVLIPHGRVTSYGAIARYLGSPGAARMVGWAMNQCRSYHTYVPAHRVVNRQGLLTAKHRFEGSKLMEELLANEGVAVRENQVQNFDDVFWDPVRELGL